MMLQVASLQHLQINETQTTATINSRVGPRPPTPDIVNPNTDFSAPEGDHPMPGIGNIEMPQGQASSSSALESDGSNDVVTCPICLESLLALEDVKKLLSCQHCFHQDCVDKWLVQIEDTTCPMCRQQVDHNDRPHPHLPAPLPSCLCRYMANERKKYDLPSLWRLG
ncbi:hypothetical protein GPALN_004573 [Globodera pallida]|nr:hypothetical protein GPALN_004573 [Globodera pallida]